MKKQFGVILTVLLILMVAMPLSYGADIPKPTNWFYVNDFADVLSDETEQSIISTSASLADASGAQIVIVTVPSLEGESIEDYALDLFRDWGIGDAK